MGILGVQPVVHSGKYTLLLAIRCDLFGVVKRAIEELTKGI